MDVAHLFIVTVKVSVAVKVLAASVATILTT